MTSNQIKAPALPPDQHYRTLAICASLPFARAVFKEAISQNPTGDFTIRSRARIVKRHPDGVW